MVQFYSRSLHNTYDICYYYTEVMDAGGGTRTVAIVNVIPYRGVHPAHIPNRVWDLPPEL